MAKKLFLFQNNRFWAQKRPLEFSSVLTTTSIVCEKSIACLQSGLACPIFGQNDWSTYQNLYNSMYNRFVINKLANMPLEHHKTSPKKTYFNKFELWDPKTPNLQIQPAKLQFLPKWKISFGKQKFSIRRACDRKIGHFEAY